MVIDSTLRDVRRAGAGPPSRWVQRTGLTVLLLIVVAGAVGVFGVHSRTTTTRSGGYELSVTYPQTARAGLDVPWRVHVHHDSGFNSAITLAVSTDYWRMFETQGFFPDADSSTNDGRFVYLNFQNPRGTDFVLDYDAYIQPAAQIGKSATVKLIVHGTVVAEATLHTWLVP
jgi:hypothetical protein